MSRKLLHPLTVCLMALAGTLFAGAASAQNVSVTAANPNTGAQGTTALLVKINGKNFAPGAKTDFFLSGTTNPDGIVVHGTQWVSATEVDATIDIADTASIAQFDIKVTNTTGRSGKGSDIFSVIQKTANGSCTGAPLDPHFSFVGHLNDLVSGQPRYKGNFGVGLAARLATLTYSTGSRDVIVLAVGANSTAPQKIEVFFMDPTTGTVIDNTAFVAGAPVQPHVSVDVSGLSSTFSPQQVAVGDVNHDGVPDFVASGTNGGDAVALALGHRAANGVVSYTVASIPRPAQYGRFGLGIGLGDINGDGFDEIVVSKGFAGSGKKAEFPKVLIYSAASGVPSLVQTLAPAGTQTATDVEYGYGIAVGDVNGDGLADVEVGTPEWTLGGQNDVGAVLVHLSTGSSPAMVQTTPVILLAGAPQQGDWFGGRVAIGELTGDPASQKDLLAQDSQQSNSKTADVFQGPIFASGQPSTPSLRLSPAAGMTNGWGTTGAAISDLTADGLTDVVVGAPNTPDSGSCTNVGSVYVFIAQGTLAIGTTGWSRYLIQPPTLTGDTSSGAFGWSAATVPGSPFVFVGAKGQVYIYKVLAP
jgi:hypothetical protein